MKRIFLTLCVVGNFGTLLSFVLGWMIDDATVAEASVQNAVSLHLTIAVASIVFAMMCHAITLTYFMGTGRWVEETSAAYKLDRDFYARNQKLKYQALPGMILCIVMLVITGAIGAATDPASHVGFKGWFGIPAPTVHFLTAAFAVFANLVVNFLEYNAIASNADVIHDVVSEVNRIRAANGLEV